MKKLFFFVICAASLTATQAQVKFGIKAGANLANVTGDIEENSMKIGLNAGAFANITIAEAFSIQPEVVYSAQGTKLDFEGTDVKMNLSYVNIPIMAQYKIPAGLFFETGPQFGILASSKFKADDAEEDIEGLKSLDISWGIGAGFATKSGFGVNARFNLGLSKINDTEDEDDSSIKNSVIQIGVFYAFGK